MVSLFSSRPQTRMQALAPSPGAPHYKNVGNALKTIARQEGLIRTFRGLPLVATGAGPSHALYFACYEKLKKVLSTQPGKNPVANGISGYMFNPARFRSSQQRYTYHLFFS